jgi:two-component system sensor histidine kinase YesM
MKRIVNGKRKSISTHLLIYFTLLAVIPSGIIASFSHIFASRTIREKISAVYEKTIIQDVHRIDSAIEKIDQLLIILINDPQSVEYIRNLKQAEFPSEIYINTYFLDEALTRSNIIVNTDLVAAIFDEGKLIYTYGCYFPQSFNSDVVPDPFVRGQTGDSFLSNIVPNPQIGYTNEYAYLVTQQIRDSVYRKDLDMLGTVQIYLGSSFFNNIFESGNDIQTVIHLSRENLVLTEEILKNGNESIRDSMEKYPFILENYIDSNGLTTVKHDDNNYFLFYAQSDYSGIKIFKLVPVEYFTEELRFITIFTILILLVTLVPIFIITALITSKISSPIKKIAHAMEQIGDQNFNIKVYAQTYSEIDKICHGFNTMTQEITHLFKEAVLQERNIQEAKIKALRYQLNPHFIHNTLTSIRLLALKERNDKTADMLLLLGKLLKITFKRSSNFVPLSSEIFYIKDYIQLMQMRYDSDIQFQIDVPEEHEMISVPSMLLQPIIENAILHGLNDKLNDGDSRAVIKLSVEQKDTSLYIIIYDNGSGYTEKPRPEISKGTDIGIANIRERLSFLGSGYDLDIESEQGNFTRVIIQIPYIEYEEPGGKTENYIYSR